MGENKLLIALIIAAVAMWAFTAGTYSVASVRSETMPDLYKSYNYITMHEDGSYEGQTIGGVKVTGCIENAPCDENKAE